jgi:acetoin utilization protein AcuB
MIVREVMKIDLVTVKPDDTLSHAANLLRQYQFHHLPVVTSVSPAETQKPTQEMRKTIPIFAGLLTSEDIDLISSQDGQRSSETLQQSWQERRVVEVMHQASIRVNPTTNIAAAAQILVERGLNCLPVVEYEPIGAEEPGQEPETRAVLVGLLTRSDLLIALARLLGAYEPGMQLAIPLPMGSMEPLAQTLLIASELHVHVLSVVAAPMEGNRPQVATVRLGTIHPTPMLVRLQKEHIQYSFADPLSEGGSHA